MKRKCRIDEGEVEVERAVIPCVTATCPACKHAEMSYGNSEDSVTRSLVMLRKNCPRKESNYYVVHRVFSSTGQRIISAEE